MTANFLDYKPDNDLLNDKIILVTGAGDGIGKAAAVAFAGHGATVILAGRTIAKLEIVYDQIEQSGFPVPMIYPVDLNGASEEDYLTLRQSIEQEFGRLDGLLHNASELGDRTPIANYKLTVWEKVLQTNVTAQFMMTKALLPVLEKANNGSIVFTSSGVGRKGKAFWGAYAVSKFATEGLCQVLASELEETTAIRVNCINPGATRTAMRARAYPAEDPGTVRTPEEIIGTYLYLMGDESLSTTGQSLNAQ